MNKLLIILAALLTLTTTPALAQEADEPRVAATAKPASSPSVFEVALNVGPGYGTYFSIEQADNGRVLHGAFVNLGMDMTWGGRTRVGMRIHTGIAPVLSQDGVEPGDQDYYRGYDVSAGFLLKVGGFWFSPGLGMQIMTEMEHDGDGEHRDNGTGVAPEFSLGFGYTFDISRHLGINIAMETGSTFGLLWRFQANGALQLRF